MQRKHWPDGKKTTTPQYACFLLCIVEVFRREGNAGKGKTKTPPSYCCDEGGVWLRNVGVY